jgi:hypothetical protein
MNLASRQGIPRCDKANREPLTVMPLATARGIRVPDPRANFSPAFPLTWTRERAERLHQFCKTVERQRAAGVSVRKAVKHFAWFWKDRPYRTAPHIKARFGGPTLVALYYYWRRNGKSPGCFALHYADRLAPITPKEMRRFLDACGNAGTISPSQATILAGFERARACRIRARLPGPLVRQIKKIFKARRLAKIEARRLASQFREQKHLLEIEARKLVKQSQGQKHRLLAADAARSRKLTRLAESFIRGRRVAGVESTSLEGKAPLQAIQGPLQANLKGVGNVG